MRIDLRSLEKIVVLALAVATLAASLGASEAHAQSFSLASGPAYKAFPAVNLDAGVARDLDGDRFGWLAAAAAGVGLFDGSRVWDFTLGIRKIEGDPYQVTLSVARLWVESGLGLHLQGLWLPSRGTLGAGVGASFTIVEAQVAMLFDNPRTKYAALFLHVPVGLIVHHLRK